MAVSQISENDNTSKRRQTAKVFFAKQLSGNDKKIRDKGLKKLKVYLTLKSNSNFVFTEEDLMAIWTGLYYSMWMSDMPLTQEDLAESISKLIHCFKGNTDAALLFIKLFNVTIGEAWSSLDQHRIDKFSMFVRRFLRQSLHFLEQAKWDPLLVKNLMNIYKEHVLAENITLGFKLHFIDIFLEELAKVSKGELSPGVLLSILEAFAFTAVTTDDGRVRAQCEEFFRHLIKQTDVAIAYNEKFDAWKRAGFPGGDPNLMVLASDDEEGEDDVEESAEVVEEGPLDPRAGSQHATLPQIQLPIIRVAKLMKRLVSTPNASLRGKRLLLALHRRFKTLHKGKYPFAVGKLYEEGKDNLHSMIAKSVRRELNSEMKRKKKRKRVKDARKKNAVNSASDVQDTQMELKKKTKKLKSKDSIIKPKKNSTKKVKTIRGFEVAADVQPADTGKRKVCDGGELPPGWIVELCDENEPPAKRKAVEVSWEVDNAETATPKDESPMNNLFPVSPILREPTEKPAESKPSRHSKATSMLSTPTKSKVGDKAQTDKTQEICEDECEIELEIKKKSPPKTPAFFSHAMAKVHNSSAKKTPIRTPNSMLKNTLISTLNNSKGDRRISFNLAKNMSQEKTEYFEQLQRSPQVPFDANRMPTQSALKQGLPPSPINPFYAIKLGLKSKT